VRRRQRSQSVVEFGIIALLFTLLVFAVIDFGLLLNSWIRISSATREIGRAATVGYPKQDLAKMTTSLALPGVVQHLANTPFAGYCCSAGDALVLTITRALLTMSIGMARAPQPCRRARTPCPATFS